MIFYELITNLHCPISTLYKYSLNIFTCFGDTLNIITRIYFNHLITKMSKLMLKNDKNFRKFLTRGYSNQSHSLRIEN